MKNLDYTSANFIYVRNENCDIRKHACPNSVFNKVVAITMKRFSQKIEMYKEDPKQKELMTGILDKLVAIEKRLEN